jgi:uncharacterized membrane protein YdbT with pleckstrin-like domain
MEQNKMRCHISIVIENAGKLLGVLLAIAISQFDDIIKNISRLNKIEGKSYFIGFGVFVAVFIVVLLLNLNRWFRTTIWLENGTLIVEQNTLNKKKNTYTIKNISNIDMEQNLFERLLGTYKLKIDTNSSALANKTDIKIVFSKQRAIEFKKEIMSSMGQVDNTNLMDSEDEDFDVVYSTKEIILHCFYTANIFSVLFLIGGFVGFFVLMRYGDNNYTINDFLGDAVGGLVAISIAGVSAVYSLVKGFFSYYGFKAKRNGGRIHLSYGLFRKNIHTIPVDKINGIKLVQPFFSRFFGRYQVELINVGTGDEKNESANILLSCTKKEVKQYMAVLVPEFEDFIDKPIEKQSKKCFLHMTYELLLAVLGFVIGFSIFNYFCDILPLWVECLISGGFLLIFVLGYIVSYFAGGYYVGQEYLIVAKGIFTKTCFMIRYEKIQHIQIKESFISKVTKLNKSTIYILAALLNSVMELPLVEEDILEQIAKKMIEAS